MSKHTNNKGVFDFLFKKLFGLVAILPSFTLSWFSLDAQSADINEGTTGRSVSDERTWGAIVRKSAKLT